MFRSCIVLFENFELIQWVQICMIFLYLLHINPNISTSNLIGKSDTKSESPIYSLFGIETVLSVMIEILESSLKKSSSLHTSKDIPTLLQALTITGVQTSVGFYGALAIHRNSLQR